MPVDELEHAARGSDSLRTYLESLDDDQKQRLLDELDQLIGALSAAKGDLQNQLRR